MKNLRISFFVLIVFFLRITTVWSAPQKNEQNESFWFWSDDEVSRKAQQIVWWQARLGEAKKKKIKYRPTRPDNSPKNSVDPDDTLPRARRARGFTP